MRADAQSALTSLEPGIALADDEQLAASTYDLAIRVTRLGGFQGRRGLSLFLFSFAEELTESLAEASDLTFLADLLLFAGIEGVGRAGDIQRHIG